MALTGLTALLGATAGVLAQESNLAVELASLTVDEQGAAGAVVTVTGVDGRPAQDLGKAAFQVQLNGEAVPVSAVSQGVDSSLGIAVVLALDTSGSMEGDALEQAKSAAHGFLSGLGPQDSVAIMAFHDIVDLPQGFTLDQALAGAAIDELTAGGQTALYDATAESVRLAATSGTTRRAVVLLSDGVDNGSTLSATDAVATAQSVGVPVFAIGLGDKIDRTYLQELASRSGGRFAETPSPEGLTAVYAEAGELLRGQYILKLDVSVLSLVESEEAVLRVDVSAGDLTGGAERGFCLQRLCLALDGLEPGEQPTGAQTLTVRVISPDPVLNVELLVDGKVRETLVEPPYQFTFAAATFGEGEHSVRVRAATDGGATASSRLVTVQSGAALATTGLGGVTLVLIAAGAAAVGGVAIALLLLWRARRRRDRSAEAAAALAGGGPLPDAPVVAAPEPKKPTTPIWPKDRPAPPVEPARPLGYLKIVGGPLSGQTFPVGTIPASIGSGHRCQIQLEDPTDGPDGIPPEAARVWVKEGQLVKHDVKRLTDTGAVGGGWTFMDPGEVFTIGSCTFRFDLAGESPRERAQSEGGEPEEVPNLLREVEGKEASSETDGALGDEDSGLAADADMPKAREAPAPPASMPEGGAAGQAPNPAVTENEPPDEGRASAQPGESQDEPPVPNILRGA